jgi:zinc/manganese transport system substrate-binding protein
MKNLFIFIAGSLANIFILAGLPALSLAQVKIFACEPEWKALAKEIGGDLVDAESATSAFQDPHHIRAKPSLIAAMRRADLVFCSGAGLEVGWLPILLQKSGSSEVQPGSVGYLMAFEYVQVLEKPQILDRSLGDIHPEGNPHVHLNPNNLIKVASELTNRLSKIDPENSGSYSANLEKFKSKWNGLITKWQAESKQLENMSILVQHKSWSYLLNWLGINAVASLEPKPGIPPTISHLENILQVVKNNKPKAIILTPYESEDGAEWVNERTNIPVLVLPYTVGGNDNAVDLKSLFEDIINRLKEVK